MDSGIWTWYSLQREQNNLWLRTRIWPFGSFHAWPFTIHRFMVLLYFLELFSYPLIPFKSNKCFHLHLESVHDRSLPASLCREFQRFTALQMKNFLLIPVTACRVDLEKVRFCPEAGVLLIRCHSTVQLLVRHFIIRIEDSVVGVYWSV